MDSSLAERLSGFSFSIFFFFLGPFTWLFTIEAHHLARARRAFTKHWGEIKRERKKKVNKDATARSTVPSKKRVDAAEMLLCSRHTRRKQEGKLKKKKRPYCVINDEAGIKKKNKKQSEKFGCV